MFKGLIFIFTLGLSAHALASAVEIFEVRKSLPMGPRDPVYKDYYLSGGRNAGLQKHMIVTVVRFEPLFDHARSVVRGELRVRLGQLKILYVDQTVSVARLYQYSSKDETPVTDVENFLLGDQVDLSDAFLEAAPLPQPTPPLAASPSPAAGPPSQIAIAPAQSAVTSPSPAEAAKVQVPIVDIAPETPPEPAP